MGKAAALWALLWVAASAGAWQTQAERAVAIVLGAGTGAKCDGKPLKKGDLILPGQRVTTGNGWVHLMTKKWGERSLSKKESWPPLNPPKPVGGAERLFRGIVALFKRQQVTWNAGTKSAMRPERFDLIGIAWEVRNPEAADHVIRLSYAVLPGRASEVRATSGKGKDLPFLLNRKVGALGDHDVYVCELNGEDGGSLSLATLSASDRVAPLTFPSTWFSWTFADRERFASLNSKLALVKGLSELLSVGYLFEALGSDGEIPKSLCPVRALQAYLRVLERSKSEQDLTAARVALFTELEGLNCPLEWYVAPAKS